MESRRVDAPDGTPLTYGKPAFLNSGFAASAWLRAMTHQPRVRARGVERTPGMAGEPIAMPRSAWREATSPRTPPAVREWIDSVSRRPA